MNDFILNPDVKRAFDMLSGKRVLYTMLWKYYDGVHPLVYVSSEVEKLFHSKLKGEYTQNWCAVVVDAIADRINLSGINITPKGDGDSSKKEADILSERVRELIDRTELLIEADDAHKSALVCGEGFVIAWTDDDGKPVAYYNDPRQCHVFYEPEYPNKKQFAAKWWVDDAKKLRLTLYYADRIEYYISTQNAENVSSASAFAPLLTEVGNSESWKVAHDYGVVPVFHFRTERRVTKSLLVNAVPIQDALNKLNADMMVAAESGAFGQRWVISNADTLNVPKGGGRTLWQIPAGDGVSQDVQVGEFSTADLQNYTNAISAMANAMGAVTGVPYFYFIRTGNVPSGEALLALEAPLVKRVNDRIQRFTPTWRSLVAFLMTLDGSAIDEERIQPVWDNPRTQLPQTEATVVKADVEAGMPLNTSLRKQGWNERDLAQMAADPPNITDAVQLIALGASKREMLRRRGFDDTTIEKMLTEDAADSTTAAEQAIIQATRR